MSGRVTPLLEDYLTLRRGLGYHSPTQERALRAFARYLDQDDHEGPIPLERSLDWATSTASTDPCNPSRRLTSVRGFLRHLSALDGATEVPAPGLLGPQGHRTLPHIYTDREIADLLQAAAGLSPSGGLRPLSYVTLLGLLACTGLRIAEALALTCADVDLAGSMLTVRAGKRGLTRLVPLHPTAAAALRNYADQRAQRCGPPSDGEMFLRTDLSDRISYNSAHQTFSGLRRQLGVSGVLALGGGGPGVSVRSAQSVAAARGTRCWGADRRAGRAVRRGAAGGGFGDVGRPAERDAAGGVSAWLGGGAAAVAGRRAGAAAGVARGLPSLSIDRAWAVGSHGVRCV